MKPKYQNAFFLFGTAVLVLMLAQLDYTHVWHGLCHVGYWSLAVMALWAFLYIFNTASWYIIVNSGGRTRVRFWWLYKITVSGFALNYATPGGLMGGEPYRMMSLSPIVGAERASSSVILFAMTHIFSHFWFWLVSVCLYVAVRPVDFAMGCLLAAVTAFCLLGLWFFIAGYRRGLAMRAMTVLRRVPYVRRWACPFVESHRSQLDTIDSQIAALHRQNSLTLIAAVGIELACRICSAAEIYFVLRVLQPSASYSDCVLILAFTSLFANLLFFLPLQIGGREGGFLMSAAGLGMTAGQGAFVALIVRLRELVWTGIGLLLIKVAECRGKDRPT